MTFPTPHLEKLNAALVNDKLPTEDKAAIKAALDRYANWIREMTAVEPTDKKTSRTAAQVVTSMVALLTDYKFYVDAQLIFGSGQDFLYRQKGQLKLDNSIIEEFLPHLIAKVLPGIAEGYDLGPKSCYSALYFQSSLGRTQAGGGPQVREKDQDFAIGRRLFIKTALEADFTDEVNSDTYLGFITAECKTNLDKTMFQEASATAHDVKSAVPGAKYYLLCEWLDMTPVSTAPTDIDEVLILRRAKRTPSNIRKNFSSAEGRAKARDDYEQFLKDNPFQADVFLRLIEHIEGVLSDQDPDEDDVLAKGFF